MARILPGLATGGPRRGVPSTMGNAEVSSSPSDRSRSAPSTFAVDVHHVLGKIADVSPVVEQTGTFLARRPVTQ